MKKAAWTSMMLLLVGASTALAQPGQKGAEQRAEGHGRGRMHHFAALDQNGDGKVTREEWLAHHEARFTEADANKDGQVSKEEREKVHAARREEHFTNHDKNGDGKITRDEVQGRSTRMFAHQDQNHDGAITREEHAMRGGKGNRPHGHGEARDDRDDSHGMTREGMRNRAAERFTQFDANGDGVMTPNELGHRRGRGMRGKH